MEHKMITQWTLDTHFIYVHMFSIVILIQKHIIMGLLLMSLLLFYIVSRCLNATYDFILWSMKALLGYQNGKIRTWMERTINSATTTNNNNKI